MIEIDERKFIIFGELYPEKDYDFTDRKIFREQLYAQMMGWA